MRIAALLIVILVVGCGSDPVEAVKDADFDAGIEDAPHAADATDATVHPDADPRDADQTDVGFTDAEPVDLASPDAEPVDLASPDADPLDLAFPDADPLDLAFPDADPLDLAFPDAAIDAGTPDVGFVDLPDGAPCVNGSECLSGQCLRVVSQWICGTPCSSAGDCSEACGLLLVNDGSGDRLQAACVAAGTGGRRFGEPCAIDDECASAICHDGLCSEVCGACVRDALCDPTDITRFSVTDTVSLCRWHLVEPALDLGPTITSTLGSAEILFTVPANQTGFVLVLIDQDGLRVAVRSLVSPSGVAVIDLADGLPDLNPAVDYVGTASVLVPDTDSATVTPEAGLWRLQVGTFDPLIWGSLVPQAGDLEHVLVIFEEEGEQGGNLDLNLWFAPGTGLSAQVAPTSPFLQDLLTELTLSLAQANIRLGAIRFGDLGGAHDVVENGDETRQICSTYAAPGPHNAAINIAFVQNLTYTGGHAGGIPGPPGVYGTQASCIVAQTLGTGTDTGILTGHELGHFLGLHHTTHGGGVYDPISDTPECPSGTPVQNCPDFTNMLFPVFPLQTNLWLSPGQIFVLRNNPILYEVRRESVCSASTLTYDFSETGFATGDTTHLGATYGGSCGGTVGPERAHLYSLRTNLSALEITATGIDFAPVLHVRQGDCDDPLAEVFCISGNAGVPISQVINLPSTGDWFIFVDSRDGTGGSFLLEAVRIP